MSDVHWCQSGEKRGELTPLKGRTVLTKVMKFVHPQYEGDWPIEESSASGLAEVEGRGVLQDLIPDVGSCYFSRFLLRGWVIDTDQLGFPHGPGDSVCFPAYSGEAVHVDGVFCRLAVLLNG